MTKMKAISVRFTDQEWSKLETWMLLLEMDSMAQLIRYLAMRGMRPDVVTREINGITPTDIKVE